MHNFIYMECSRWWIKLKLNQYFSQAAKMVTQGNWLLSRYQGLDSEPNFYWYVGIGDMKAYDFNNDRNDSSKKIR